MKKRGETFWVECKMFNMTLYLFISNTDLPIRARMAFSVNDPNFPANNFCKLHTQKTMKMFLLFITALDSGKSSLKVDDGT